MTAAAGLLLAAQAHRRSSPLLGVLVCAATCLLVSPISWVHHLVWVVPAILWLAFAPDRPRFGPVLAGATASSSGARPSGGCRTRTPRTSTSTCSTGSREFVLLRHAAVHRRHGGTRAPARPRGVHERVGLPVPAVVARTGGVPGARAPLSVRCARSDRIALLGTQMVARLMRGGGVAGESPGGFVTPPPSQHAGSRVDRSVRRSALTLRGPISSLEGRWGPGWRG